MIPPVHNLLHLPPVIKIRFFTFPNTSGSRKKSFNCVQVSETPPSSCLSSLQQTRKSSLSSAVSTCSPKAPQIWVLHPCPGTTCTHQAAQPEEKGFAFPTSLPAACRIFDQRLRDLQPGPSPSSASPEYSRQKKASEQLRKKWFEKPEGWSRAGDARGTWGRQL